MKKLFIFILILIFSNISFSLTLEGKGGFSLKNEYDLDSLGSADGQLTIKFAGEAWWEASSNTDIGVGIGLIINGNAETDPIEGGNMNLFTSYPIYGTAKYKFDKDFGGYNPFGKFNLGLSINDVGTYEALLESKIGLYIGFGAGLQKDALTFELMYEMIRSDLNFETGNLGLASQFPYPSLSVTNTMITFSVGYQFETK